VSKVVQALAHAKYTFQKHKVATQDDGVPKTKKITISSVSNLVMTFFILQNKIL
jgi:hypothetical protein